MLNVVMLCVILQNVVAPKIVIFLIILSFLNELVLIRLFVVFEKCQEEEKQQNNLKKIKFLNSL
jgi:hypothetical protein